MPPGPGGPGAGMGAPGQGKPPAPKAGAGDAGKKGFSLNLTKEQQNNLVAIGLVSVLAIVAYVKYWAMPVMDNYKKKTAVLEQKKKELSDAREMVSKYSEFLARASEINRKVDFINKRLPKDINIADTIREITKTGTENNINILKFEPGKELNKGDYKEFSIAVTYRSNYRDMGNFLTGIGYLERLTIPSDLKVQRLITETEGEATKNLSVDMKIKIYSLAE
jgi:Tfp pilus assembly protein PilO